MSAAGFFTYSFQTVSKRLEVFIEVINIRVSLKVDDTAKCLDRHTEVVRVKISPARLAGR